MSISIIWDSANSFYASTIRHVLEEQLLEIWRNIFSENCDISLEMTFMIRASVRAWIQMLICFPSFVAGNWRFTVQHFFPLQCACCHWSLSVQVARLKPIKSISWISIRRWIRWDHFWQLNLISITKHINTYKAPLVSYSVQVQTMQSVLYWWCKKCQSAKHVQTGNEMASIYESCIARQQCVFHEQMSLTRSLRNDSFGG